MVKYINKIYRKKSRTGFAIFENSIEIAPVKIIKKNMVGADFLFGNEKKYSPTIKNFNRPKMSLIV